MISPELAPEDFEGLGSSSSEEVAQLIKALEAQQGVTDIANLRDVGALQMQSLETTLAVLVAQEKHLTMYRAIPKGSASSTLEEYTIQTGYGTEGGWLQQLEAPIEGDPTAARRYSTVKYLRSLWRVSGVSSMVGTIKDAEVWAKQSATMRVLRQLNTTLYSGDSTIVPDSIDGFERTIRNNGSAAHVIDLRGGLPTQETFDQAAELIMQNFGDPNAKIFLSPGGQNTIAQVMKGGSSNLANSSLQRILQSTVGADGKVDLGFAVRNIHTQFGTMEMAPDIFLGTEYENHSAPVVASAANPEVTTEGATSARAPKPPVTVSPVAVGATVPGSKWAGTGVRPAGAYRYRVYAVNRYGKSAATAVSSAATVVADGAIDVTITPDPSSTYPATGFVILGETAVGSGIYRYCGKIAANGLSAVVFRDLNAKIPGTTSMFVLDMNSVGEMRTCQLRQLAPLHSQEYATIGPFRWGAVNLYTAMQYYAPLRFVLIDNVRVGLTNASNSLLTV